MPAWLSSIVTSVFKAGMEYLKLWYDQEKAKEHEWNAKTRKAQLRTMKDADKMALEIKDAKPFQVNSPSDWNLTPLLLVAVLILSSGCALFTKYVHVPSKLPYIVVPARPQVPTQPVTWTVRETLLKNYGLELEAKVKAYNGVAKRENVKNGYEDAVPE